MQPSLGLMLPLWLLLTPDAVRVLIGLQLMSYPFDSHSMAMPMQTFDGDDDHKHGSAHDGQLFAGDSHDRSHAHAHAHAHASSSSGSVASSHCSPFAGASMDEDEALARRLQCELESDTRTHTPPHTWTRTHTPITPVLAHSFTARVTIAAAAGVSVRSVLAPRLRAASVGSLAAPV